MARQFNSLGEMGMALALRVPEMAVELSHGLEKALARMEATARTKFGDYQAASGPFPGWAPLAEATKEDRVAHGFPEDEPLLRTGATRDSFSHAQQGLEGAMGSTDPKMPWFEYGTPEMPPRPVVGPAAFENKDALQKLVGAALVAGLVGRDEAQAMLGFDFKTRD